MKTQKTAKKRITRPALKSLKIAFCLEGDCIFTDTPSPRFTLERDDFVEKYFKDRVRDMDFLQMQEIEANLAEVAQQYDVLVTHVPPAADENYRMMCNELRADELISREAFLFADYSHTLNIIRQLAHAGLPVIGYTKACEEAVEIFERTGLFRAVLRKTGYFKKDCLALEDLVRDARQRYG